MIRNIYFPFDVGSLPPHGDTEGGKMTWYGFYQMNYRFIPACKYPGEQLHAFYCSSSESSGRLMPDTRDLQAFSP